MGVKAIGTILDHRKGEYIRSGQLAPKVMRRVEVGQSYGAVAKELKLSKNTVMGSVHRHRNKA